PAPPAAPAGDGLGQPPAPAGGARAGVAASRRARDLGMRLVRSGAEGGLAGFGRGQPAGPDERESVRGGPAGGAVAGQAREGTAWPRDGHVSRRLGFGMAASVLAAAWLVAGVAA